MNRVMLVFLFSAITVSTNLVAHPVGVTPPGARLHAKDETLIFESGVSYNGSNAEDLYYSSITYRKATDLFRIPLHTRLEMGVFLGRGCKKKACNKPRRHGEQLELVDLDTPIIGVAEEITLIDHRYFDVSFSVGGYLKTSSSRVGSVFTFGERLAISAQSKKHNVSLFVRHFSNASITPDNGGYNFIGLSINSRF